MFGLRKTLSSLFTRHRVDEAWFDHLEELLIKADVGVATSTFLITSLRKSAKEHAITNSEDLKADLVSELSHHLSDLEPPENPLNPSAIHAKPEVWLIVGVNGAGKTTSIGKLCHCLLRVIHSEQRLAINSKNGVSAIKFKCLVKKAVMRALLHMMQSKLRYQGKWISY
jgi:signal recognition particle GTPase